MSFEQIEPGKSTQQILEEVSEDFDNGFYNRDDRRKAEAALETARLMTRPGSPEQQEIDRLLADIISRYGDD
ncbi:MAG: hypothetical protein E6Q06_01520 [Candidatus Moraniibacteriota bacterium]|nr:MAG: hypothetical protein E6Q06_01520 [Candidatus Moranbacteria bacterium]